MRARSKMAPPHFSSTLVHEAADIETSSEEYASRFAGPVGELFLDIQQQAVLELLAPWPGARVLDVGGGHAQLAPPLVRSGYRVTVAGSGEACRDRLDRALPAGTFEYQACDLLDLPFPDRSFDAVLAFRLLAHAERWRDLVAELCRVADRAVIVDFADTRSFNAFYGPLFAWKKKIEGNTRTFITFRPGEVRAELARHGLGRPKEIRQFFLPMVVHRALGKALGSALPSRVLEGVSSGLGLTRALGSPVILRAEREE
jgi:SAM-dependent methyltransferase